MTTPLGFPDLNFDILFYIISRLTRRNVACLSSTCHALRRALSPELPRGGVTLEARYLTSFVLFADVKHGEDRLRYLHTLVLPGSTYQSISTSKQDIERSLSTVMLAAPNLRSLSILDLNVLLFRPATLKKIFKSLPRLRELEITAIQKKYEGEGVLENVLPRLRRLGLTFDEMGINANTFLQLPPEAPQNELREVTLDYGMFDPPSSSFPAVRTLRISPFTLPSDIDALTDLFPNVEDVTLDFHTEYCLLESDYSRRAHRWYLPDTPWTDPAAKTSRDHLLNRPERKADAWPQIQSLRITGLSINDVAWAGLACQVPRLEVCCRLLKVQPLAGVLRELRTSCVVFHPGVFHAPGKTRSGGWGMLRALETAPCVTRLAIILCQGLKNRVWHALQWSEESLGNSSVSCMLLRLEFEYPKGEGPSNLLQRWWRALSSKVPSLRILLVQTKGDIHFCWQKERRTGGGWKEINEDEGRKLIASEKMCPSSIEPCEQCKIASAKALRRQRLV